MTTQEMLQRIHSEVLDSIDTSNEYRWPQFSFVGADGLWDVDFYGDPADDAFPLVCAGMAHPDVAPYVRSLMFFGPDEGANGTRNFDLTPLLQVTVPFAQLSTFFVEPTAPHHHNFSIISRDCNYEEDGIVARLLALMPRLEALTIPSAPNADFFGIGSDMLSFVRVDSGYDNQNFIANLSRSHSFPALRLLDFGEAPPNSLSEATLLADYHALLTSSAFPHLRGFRLHNANLSPAQWQELQQLRPDMELQRINADARYKR